MLAAGIYQLETIQDVLPARVESYQWSDDKIMKTKKGLMQRPTVMCYWNYLWPKTNAPQEFLFLPLDETKKTENKYVSQNGSHIIWNTLR